MLDKRKINKALSIVKYILPIIVFAILYNQLEHEFKNLDLKSLDFDSTKLMLILLLLILMSLNWLIESLKWKYLVSKIAPINFYKSFKSIVNGLAFGLVTPFKIGEVFTRILHIDSENRSKALGSLLVSRGAQLITTSIFGVIGLTYFSISHLLFSPLIWTITIAVIIVLLFIYFNLKQVIPFLSKFNITNNYIHLIDVLYNYSMFDYLKVLLFSVLRYSIFIIQYYIMFYIFNVDISMGLLFTGISVVFLVKSILPISILGDVGIRELAAVTIFGLMGFYKPVILLITLSIWVLNIVIPSIIGSFFTKENI